MKQEPTEAKFVPSYAFTRGPIFQKAERIHSRLKYLLLNEEECWNCNRACRG